jgi:hypothetical protein
MKSDWRRTTSPCNGRVGKLQPLKNDVDIDERFDVHRYVRRARKGRE